MTSTLKVLLVFLIASSLIPASAVGQGSNKLESRANVLEGGVKDGISYKRLTGNVVFTQMKTTIYCDSAIAYDKTNTLEAFGRVRIEDLEDSVTITSNRLYYDGNGRLARLRGNVVYIDDSIRLYTDNLDYNMVNKSANYFDGGRIEDGINTLNSRKGNYDTESKVMIFNEEVIMVTPDYTLETNDLVYNIITKKARTSGDTRITTNDGRVLKSEKSSEFDTGNNTSLFLDGEVDTDKYYLKADELFFDNQTGSYSATGNVYLYSKEDDVIITGQKANFWQDQGLARVYGDPLMKKTMQQDTLYLRADTLISIDDSLEVNKRLLAYQHVVIYKNDVQGRADSLAYFIGDSTMVMYRDPILWNEGSQITADTIQVLVSDGSIDQLRAKTNSFIISEDSVGNYNQVKGRRLTAYFEGKSVSHVDVTGNGESIYYIADEIEPDILIGMNRILCSNMKIAFKENQVHDIRFYSNPDGKFVPPHELNDDLKFLAGFRWRIKERPSLESLTANQLSEPEEELQSVSDSPLQIPEMAPESRLPEQ